MTGYRVVFQPRARTEFLDLPTDVGRRVHSAIHSLETEPRPRQSIKLSGAEGYRIRVGDYRILYEIDDSDRTVIVYRVKHRRDAYR